MFTEQIRSTLNGWSKFSGIALSCEGCDQVQSSKKMQQLYMYIFIDIFHLQQWFWYQNMGDSIHAEHNSKIPCNCNLFL